MIYKMRRWGLLWKHTKQQTKKLKLEHLIWDNGKLLMFSTRKQAREFANEHYGYIKTRKDLREYPHYWRLPIPVKITGILFKK